MTRQLALFIILIASLLVAVFLYFTFFSNNVKFYPINHAVPNNAALIIETKKPLNNLNELVNNKWFGLMLQQKDLQKIKDNILQLDSLLFTQDNFKDAISASEIAIGVHPFANKSIGVLFCARIKQHFNITDVVDFLNLHYKGRFGYSARKFSNETIYDFTDFVKKEKFSIAFKDGLFIFSFEGMLCELSLLKLKNASFYNYIGKTDFIYHNSDGINIYIKPSLLGKLFASITNNYGKPYFVEKFCENIGFNVELRSNELYLKGVSVTHDTLFQFLDLLNGQAPVKNNLSDIIPNNFIDVLQFNLSNYKIFYTNLSEYLQSAGKYTEYKNYLDSIEQHLQINLKEDFAKYIGLNAAVVDVLEPGINADSSKIAVIEITDAENVTNLLNNYKAAVYKKNSDSAQVLLNDSLNACDLGNVFKYFWGDVFEHVYFRYYAIYQNYLLYADNFETLSAALKKIKNNQVVKNNPLHQKYSAGISEQSNITYLINGKNSYKKLILHLNNNIAKVFIKDASNLNKINFGSIQITGSIDKTFITKASFLFNTDVNEEYERLLDIPMDTTIIGNPQLVYNSLQNNQIILAQDAKLNLHFISTDGVKLNSVQLNDEIISDIFTINLYQNNKTYYVFNGNKFCYLLDEKGNMAYGWPIWIPTGTDFPLSVQQVNNQTVFFITGKLFKVLAFNDKGQLISGFNPKNIWPNAISSVNNFTFGLNNYFYVLNQKGLFNVFTPDGKDNQSVIKDTTVKFISAIITSTDTGNYQITGLSNNFIFNQKFSLSNTKNTANRKLLKEPYQKIYSNSNGFLLTFGNGFAVIDYQLNMLSAKTYPDSISNISSIYISNQQYVSFKIPAKNEIHLLSFKDKQAAGFPVKCSSGYNITNGYDGSILMTYGLDKNLILLKLR